MSCPKFYVVARVVGRDGALSLWKDRLAALCNVSATEQLGDSYYWGQDVDGEPDTLWGLEGYTHPVGFFLGHVSTQVFKEEMAKVDAAKLLRHQQGLGSPDYDLHHYDWAGGWLKRDGDPDRDSTTSHVAVCHFWAQGPSQREEIVKELERFAADQNLQTSLLQSCGLLKECRDETMLTMWLRMRTVEDFEKLHSSGPLQSLLAKIKSLLVKTEIHQSRSFNGHLDIKLRP